HSLIQFIKHISNDNFLANENKEIRLEAVKTCSQLLTPLVKAQSPDKREKAIWALGHVVSSSGFLVRPYERFPDLLNTLLTMMRTEHSKAIRRQVLRVIGCIGALDPFTLKIYLNEVDAVGDTQYILSLHEVEERSEVVSLYLDVVGQKSLSSDIRRYMISQLAEMIVKLMHEFWSEEDSEILISLIELLVSCLYACGTCFREYLPVVLPNLLNVLNNDSCEDKRLTTQVLDAVQQLGPNAEEYLHVLVPAIVSKNTVLSDFFASDPALLRVTEIGGRLSSASTGGRLHHSTSRRRDKLVGSAANAAGAAASSTANAAAVSAQQNQKLQSLVLQRSWQISSVVSKDDWHHSPLPLSVKLLADKAIKTRVYAKALYYKETEFRDCVQSKFDPSNYSDILESLISINNKLGMVESAEGVLQNAASYFKDGLRNQEFWFEKLQDWTKALMLYERNIDQHPNTAK
uniref:Serine/threonine-protein kinase TOR n=1 Tax=Macrostomum lignano TaxID=282301 RepID=A0A1I8FNJ0_9PLAT